MPDDKRTQLRNELLAGAASAPTKPVDPQYFARLRSQIRGDRPKSKTASER